MERFSYDMVIVGAGSGGYAAARTARDLGVPVALVDRGPLGGLCILRGCMPSKTLLASSDALYDMREAAQLGIHAGEITTDVPHIIARKRALVKEFADYRIQGIEQFPLYQGEAQFISPTELLVRRHREPAPGASEEIVLEAQKFIIGTGSVVAPPALEGLAEVGYIDSDTALELETLPKSMIVLGGGYVACELGQYFARLGVKVTIIIRKSRLLSGTDDDIGEALTQYFRDEGIEIIDGATLIRARHSNGRKAVDISVHGIEGEVVADEIFYALGRVPDIEGLGLELARVDAHAITGITVDDTLRTSNENIFAIGDVTCEYPLVHVAIYQGEIAARNAIAMMRRSHPRLEHAVYDLVKAYTVFSDPQVAVVGKTERDLQEGDLPYVRGQYDFAEHGKAMVLGKTKGFVKMMAHKNTGKIMGAAIIGPNASDLIHEVIVAMQYNATVQEFMRIPHLHPTLAEIWTYPAEECAEKCGLREPGDEQMEVATGASIR